MINHFQRTVLAIWLLLVSCNGGEGSKVVKTSTPKGAPVSGVVVELTYGSSLSTVRQTTNANGEAIFEKSSWSFDDCDASLAPFDVKIRFYHAPPRPLKIGWPTLSFEESARPSLIKFVSQSNVPAREVKVYDYSSPRTPKLIKKTTDDGLVELGPEFKEARKLYASSGEIGLDVDLGQWRDRSKLLVIQLPELAK
jgi:hypothetical protein